nr:DUF1294 domain-containing protein [Pseudoduganella dura]
MVAFIAYAIDKRAARAGRRRTSERTLLLIGLAGGWPGALLAQRLVRHKSSKKSFQVRFRISVAASVAFTLALLHAASRYAYSPLG